MDGPAQACFRLAFPNYKETNICGFEGITLKRSLYFYWKDRVLGRVVVRDIFHSLPKLLQWPEMSQFKARNWGRPIGLEHGCPDFDQLLLLSQADQQGTRLEMELQGLQLTTIMDSSTSLAALSLSWPHEGHMWQQSQKIITRTKCYPPYAQTAGQPLGTGMATLPSQLLLGQIKVQVDITGNDNSY